MSDSEYFEQLWGDVERQVGKISGVLMRNQSDAEDLVQEVRIKAFRRFHRFLANPVSFGGWVTRIMERTAIDMRARIKKRTHLSIDAAMSAADESSEDEHGMPPELETALSAPDQHLQTEHILLIAGELASIDRVLAADMILRTGYGYTIAEAAPLLGMTPAALKSRLDRRRRTPPRQQARMAQRSPLWRKLGQ